MHVDLANSPIGREQLIAKGRGRRDPHHDKTNPCIPMAAIASVCQPGAESGATRTPIPAQGGQHSGNCGQQVMAA
jgi:hypothetical protein